MHSLDRGHSPIDGAPAPERATTLETAALWSAIAADHRARDERTARLRAMRLSQGDDERA